MGDHRIDPSFIAEPDYAALEQLCALIERDALKVGVSSVVPLERAVEMLERIPQGGLVGKTVLTID